MIKIAVLGATGRMGSMVIELAKDDRRFNLVAAITNPAHQRDNQKVENILTTCDAKNAFSLADVLIDFSTPQAAIGHLSLAQEFKKPIFIGVTGEGEDLEKKAKETSQLVPVLLTANSSISVTIMHLVVEKMASFLDMDFDVEISEIHHSNKKDAPSGTALSLGKSVAKGRGQDFTNSYYIDHNKVRQKGQIGFAVQRGGDVVGEHTVSFYGESEVLQLTHRSLSRSIFAKGALKATLWLLNQPSGLYNMIDVIKAYE